MSTVTQGEPGSITTRVPKVIDALVRLNWATQTELMPYLAPGWQEYVGTAGLLPDGGGAIPMLPRFQYHRFGAEYEPGAGAALETTAGVVLEQAEDVRALLVHDRGLRLASLPNAQLSEALIKAANDWTIDRWLDREPRLYGTALIPTQIPDAAAREIRRVGAHPQVRAVLLGDNGLGKPFGHPSYRPIHEAAAEMGLVLVLVDGIDTSPDNLTHPVGGGQPATYAEYKVLNFRRS